MQAVQKKLVYSNIYKTGMKLQVLPLKNVKTEGFFLLLNMISEYISVAES